MRVSCDSFCSTAVAGHPLQLHLAEASGKTPRKCNGGSLSTNISIVRLLRERTAIGMLAVVGKDILSYMVVLSADNVGHSRDIDSTHGGLKKSLKALHCDQF